ncbi:hypothetical protein GCM10022212_00910 [Actimicrobium antarcticum]|uniref:Secreted protein n=1 Tax=Actimicrobium antarcticum TaxID=1051899 RepID=A0ABP7SGU4_9BURK
MLMLSRNVMLKFVYLLTEVINGFMEGNGSPGHLLLYCLGKLQIVWRLRVADRLNYRLRQVAVWLLIVVRRWFALNRSKSGPYLFSARCSAYWIGHAM